MKPIKSKHAFISLLIFALTLAGLALLITALIATGLQFDPKDKAWALPLINAVPLALALAFSLIYFKSTNYSVQFNFSLSHFSLYPIIFLFFFSLVFIGEYLTDLMPTEGSDYLESQYKELQFLLDLIKEHPIEGFIAVVISAPLFEELIFRGIVLKGFLQSKWPAVWSILLSSSLFGLVHGNPWQMVGATLIGSAIGFVYYRTQSISNAILLHALNNGFAFAMIYYYSEASLNKVHGFEPWHIAFFLCTALVSGYLLYTKTKPKWN